MPDTYLPADSEPPEDPHSGTRLVLLLFALPLAYGAGWLAFTVVSGISAGFVEWGSSQRAGYIGGAMAMSGVGYIFFRIISNLSHPPAPVSDDDLEPDDDLPADWEED